jgi:hypothetical protein
VRILAGLLGRGVSSSAGSLLNAKPPGIPPGGGSVPGGYANLSSEISSRSGFRIDIDAFGVSLGSFESQFGSSFAVVYDMVILIVLMCFPRVNTAIELPCTIIDASTKNVVIGQMSSMII